MVRPLYPLKNNRKKKPEKQPPLWKNPYILGIFGFVILLGGVFVYHISGYGSSVITDQSPSGESKGLFSFLKPSSNFKSSSRNASLQEKQQLLKMGIASDSKILNENIKAKDFREERKILAMRKYEASRETAIKFRRVRDEQLKRLSSNTAKELKRAVLALEASDNLGIMKLESLLDNHLRNTGGDSKDLDVLIYAYDSLAKVYEKKNMRDKAKEAYVNAFKLMQKKAPPSQGDGWNNAIDKVESMKTTTSRNN